MVEESENGRVDLHFETKASKAIPRSAICEGIAEAFLLTSS